jgi:hypothetical protein
MEPILAKSSGGGGSSSSSSHVVKKEKIKKRKLSVLELAQKHIPDGKFAGLLDLLEPHELGVMK